MRAGTGSVVVVGGGPAGAAAAILLRRQGHPVTVLEKAHLPRPKPCGESLSPEVTPLLRRLGVLELLRAAKPGRLSGFTIFPYEAAPFCGTYAARAGGHADRATGFAVPRLALDTWLLQAARDAGAVVHEGWAARDVSAWDGHTRLVTGTAGPGRPFRLAAELVIAADGVHSTVARRTGLLMPSSRLRQVAVVTHMRGVAGTGAYGEMHVMPHGYCGVAPLGDGLANVAVVVPAGPSLRSGGDVAAWLWACLARFPQLADRLRGAEIVAGPWTTSGLAQRVRRRVDDGLLFVGDAGGYFDPFTGEGIYRALHGAELATRVAGRALADGDLSTAALRPYAALYRRQFAPKRLVEVVVHEVITRRPLFERAGSRLRRRSGLADALVGVTGDFLSPYEVLNPWYLARLFA
jgi:flavin-dependent dehydrogenase